MKIASMITVVVSQPDNAKLIGNDIENPSKKICELIADGYKIESAIPVNTNGFSAIQYILVKDTQ